MLDPWLELLKTGSAWGITVIVLHWLTIKLIPQLQSERSEAIKAFQEETEKERLMHVQINERILASIERERQLYREDRDKLMAHYEKSLEVIQSVASAR